MWSLHTMENDSALKRKDVMTHATTWMNLKDFTLSETSKSNIVRFHLHEHLSGSEVQRLLEAGGTGRGGVSTASSRKAAICPGALHERLQWVHWQRRGMAASQEPRMTLELSKEQGTNLAPSLCLLLTQRLLWG